VIENMAATEVWQKELNDTVYYIGEEWKVRNYFVFPLDVKSFCLQNKSKTLWLMCTKEGEIIRSVTIPRKFDPDAPILGSETFIETYKRWAKEKRSIFKNSEYTS